MNEGALLERFRADLAEPDEATIGGARAKFQARLMRRRRRCGRAGVGRGGSIPAAVAAAVVLALLVPALVPIGCPGAPDPAAADLLRRFSTLAAHLPAEPAPKSGEYVYSRTSSIGSYVFVSADGAPDSSTRCRARRRCGWGWTGRVASSERRVSRNSPPRLDRRRIRGVHRERPVERQAVVRLGVDDRRALRLGSADVAGHVPAPHRPEDSGEVDRRPSHRRRPRRGLGVFRACRGPAPRQLRASRAARRSIHVHVDPSRNRDRWTDP